MDKTQDIMSMQKKLHVESETLEEKITRVANIYAKTHGTNVVASTTDEAYLTTVLQSISSQHSSEPEIPTEFLQIIPELHNSWTALKKINSDPFFRKIYALFMVTVYKRKIPFEVEKRIICLDNADKFILTLNSYGQEWSRSAQVVMRSLQPHLHNQLFEQRPIYYTFMD